MNLTKLYDTQRILDERIVQQKGLEGRDMLPEKILALLVELGELANEERCWKFWSEDRTPRVSVKCSNCGGKGFNDYFCFGGEGHDTTDCGDCEGTGLTKNKNPLLEEYVDCLHFILSIGLECGFVNITLLDRQKTSDVVSQFSKLFCKITDFSKYPNLMNYKWIWSYFLGLCEHLGFIWEQIETAYFEKNTINHKRQDTGY